jgi:RNA polymerase sigma-70 factor (ECF subfamily)
VHTLLTVLEEEILIARLVDGDKDAFASLFESYKDKVYNTSLGLLRNTKDAEDITQEVFVEIFLSIQHFKGKSKLSTWIYRITISKALDHIRRNKRRKRFAFITSLFGEKGELVTDPPDFIHPGVTAENQELSAILFNAISKLPQSQKIAFTLSKIEGLSYEETADVMNISVSAVESLMFRAKQNLRISLADYYKELD